MLLLMLLLPQLSYDRADDFRCHSVGVATAVVDAVAAAIGVVVMIIIGANGFNLYFVVFLFAVASLEAGVDDVAIKLFNFDVKVERDDVVVVFILVFIAFLFPLVLVDVGPPTLLFQTFQYFVSLRQRLR